MVTDSTSCPFIIGLFMHLWILQEFSQIEMYTPIKPCLFWKITSYISLGGMTLDNCIRVHTFCAHAILQRWVPSRINRTAPLLKL